MMTGYVIFKSSRAPRQESYNGPTWDSAGIRHLRQDVYESEDEAKRIAKLLSASNPVGFSVEPTPSS